MFHKSAKIYFEEFRFSIKTEELIIFNSFVLLIYIIVYQEFTPP
jgi:hypothetical protein